MPANDVPREDDPIRLLLNASEPAPPPGGHLDEETWALLASSDSDSEFEEWERADAIEHIAACSRCRRRGGDLLGLTIRDERGASSPSATRLRFFGPVEGGSWVPIRGFRHGFPPATGGYRVEVRAPRPALAEFVARLAEGWAIVAPGLRLAPIVEDAAGGSLGLSDPIPALGEGSDLVVVVTERPACQVVRELLPSPGIDPASWKRMLASALLAAGHQWADLPLVRGVKLALPGPPG